jgi:tetratricopeptide (TPR) repeat protein
MVTPSDQPDTGTHMDEMHLQEAQRLFLQGQWPAAQAVLSRLSVAQSSHVDALLLAGLVAQKMRALETAHTHLSRAAQLAPLRADVLTNFGNVLRELERNEEALQALERAIQLAPDHALILINLGLVHQDLQQLTQAENAFRKALHADPHLAAAHQNLGHLLMRTNLKQARPHLIRALQLSPGLHAAFKDLCAVLLSLGEPQPVLTLCMARLSQVAGDQDALAIMALALRDLGRYAEADRLVNTQVWLKRYTISAPPGYRTLPEFNAALEDHVRTHPQLTSVLFGNATHHGKRVNNLLVEPMGPMRLLAQIAMQQVQTYWAALPPMPEHPFFKQGTPAHAQLRSWAVLMERHGYETPHIHPDGLLSGVYYVQLPDVVAQTDAANAGWIEFGTPDPVYATRSTPPTRLMQPEAGEMLLFPSYFWHRTIPFDSAQERLSIAFDLVSAVNA